MNLRSILLDTRFPSEHHKPLGHLSLNINLFGAGSGNRTRNLCLGSTCFATKLYLHWRRRWDSNPRADCSTTAFRVRLSATALIRLQVVLLYCKPSQKSIVIIINFYFIIASYKFHLVNIRIYSNLHF